MLRIEEHRTDELQNQQARIRSVLGVNGFLLGFLAATGLLGPGPSTPPRPILFIYVLSLVILSAALILGIMALLPKIPIRGGKTTPRSVLDTLIRGIMALLSKIPIPGRKNPRHVRQPDGATPEPGLFLDTEFFLQGAPELAPEELLKRLCSDLEANMRKSDHVGTLAQRRWLINRQLYCISVAVLLLAIVLLGIAIR
jgi:hypothetical protein